MCMICLQAQKTLGDLVQHLRQEDHLQKKAEQCADTPENAEKIHEKLEKYVYAAAHVRELILCYLINNTESQWH